MPDVEKVIKGLECCTRDIRSQDNNPCNGCPYDVNYQNNDSTCTLDLKKDALALLKAQEHPTDECIRNAVFCLQNPHDCLETEVEEARKMSLYALKAREPKMVTGVAEMYKDILVGNCPSCDQTIVSNVKKPTKYCRFCGQGVTFE